MKLHITFREPNSKFIMNVYIYSYTYKYNIPINNKSFITFYIFLYRGDSYHERKTRKKTVKTKNENIAHNFHLRHYQRKRQNKCQVHVHIQIT